MLAKRFLISTCSKDQGHPLLKYKHVSCGGQSSCLPLLYSMYLSCVSIFGQTQTLGHGWLGQELSWKTEVWQQPIFQAGNIPNWGTGGRRAKTKSSWKLPSLCYFHHVERWRARFRFLSSMPLVSHKDLSGLLNVEASEAELMHPVGLGSMGWG